MLGVKLSVKALEQIHDVAAELLHIQARRQSKPGFAFEPDQSLYMQFASGFAYEETLDQANAIEATLYDMQQAKPMDRLVCVVMWVLGKPRWPCVQHLSQYKMANRLLF